MISLFSTGDFMRVSIKPGPFRDAFGAVGLLMGLSVVDTNLYGIVNGAEGELGAVPISDLVSDFIYDVGKDRFVDQSAEQPPDEEQDDQSVE